MSRPFKPIAAKGQIFNKWIVLDDSEVLWKVKCECGSIHYIRRDQIIRGLSKACISCGQKTHGKDGTSIYYIWAGMKQRCLNPKYRQFHLYGGRGISICERWMTFENFYADMGDRPKGKSLDRKDNDGNYSPENCRWATRKEQMRNVRTNRWIDHNGEKRLLVGVADELGITAAALRQRLKKATT